MAVGYQHVTGRDSPQSVAELEPYLAYDARWTEVKLRAIALEVSRISGAVTEMLAWSRGGIRHAARVWGGRDARGLKGGAEVAKLAVYQAQWSRQL